MLTRALIGGPMLLIKGQSGADRRRAQSGGMSGEPARRARRQLAGYDPYQPTKQIIDGTGAISARAASLWMRCESKGAGWSMNLDTDAYFQF